MNKARATFDIGSGKTKMLVADMDTVLGKLTNIHLSVDANVPFKSNVPALGEARELSSSVIQRGLGVLRELADRIALCGAVPPHAGITKDVVRRARNGDDFVGAVRWEAGIDAWIVSQKEEAAVGFLTATALVGGGSDAESGRLLAWDAISNLVRGHGAEDAPPVLRASFGQLGSSVAWCALIEWVRGARFERQTANPTSRDLAETLVEPWVGELGAAPSTNMLSINGEDYRSIR